MFFENMEQSRMNETPQIKMIISYVFYSIHKCHKHNTSLASSESLTSHHYQFPSHNSSFLNTLHNLHNELSVTHLNSQHLYMYKRKTWKMNNKRCSIAPNSLRGPITCHYVFELTYISHKNGSYTTNHYNFILILCLVFQF